MIHRVSPPSFPLPPLSLLLSSFPPCYIPPALLPFSFLPSSPSVCGSAEKREKFDRGEDPLDPEEQQARGNPFGGGFNPFGGGFGGQGQGFQFKFHFG